MIKIFHLSDFHLNKDNLRDWDTYIKSELVSMLKQEIETDNDCFVVCTGDLIDKAGIGEYDEVKKAFEDFRDNVIKPLLEETNLSIDRFIIIPGNHDVDRKKDKKFVDTGLKDEFTKQGVNYLNKFTREIIDTDDRLGVKRMEAFYEFVKELYKESSNVNVSYLGMTFDFKFDSYSVGFACLNTAWCCYDDDDYENGVYIGEEQYKYCFDKVKKCDVKVALMHHPIDWIKLEKDSIGSWMYKDYDMFLCGHVHEGQTTLTSKLYNSLFVNVAPCFTNEIRTKSCSFANGFTLIEYNPGTKKLIADYYKYKFDERKYVLNTDYVGEGKISITIFDKMSDDVESIMSQASKYIENVQYKYFDDMLIPLKANAIKSLKEAFILPRITRNGDDENKEVSLSDIINNQANSLILGSYESGKSVLLYRLVVEINDNMPQYGKIPIYIDFNEIGNENIETAIKTFLNLQSQHVNILLEGQHLILLLDNYNPTEENKHIVNRINNFIKDHHILCVATYTNDIVGVVPPPLTAMNPIAFEYFYLHPFRAENIRDLMMKWIPDQNSARRNDKISKMVNSFCSYSLPCTAMSVSLYLWSTEKEEKNPVNQATLLDIYIEIILERLSDVNVYHNTFDYDNKIMLLSYIAYRIYADVEEYNKQNNDVEVNEMYTLTYDIYISLIMEYLDLVGWKGKFEAQKLGQNFIDLKIFRKTTNTIKFTHSCFYYFFLAKRMLKDVDLKNDIISKGNYFRNDRVIDYYGGLIRSDESLLTSLTSYTEKFFEPFQKVYEDVEIDKFFTYITKGQTSYTPLSDLIDVKKIASEKPSEKAVEERNLKVCDEKLSQITDDFNRNKKLSPGKLIIMLGRALRNLDSVESVESKQKAYDILVRNSLIYTILTKNGLARYANNHAGELPPGFCEVKNVAFFFRIMPFNLQMNLNDIMGTSKLESIFREKLRKDYSNKRSDIEKYFSLAMLWDNTGTSHIADMKDFIRSIDKNCVCDYLHMKLCYSYYYKVAHGSQDEDVYLKLLENLLSKKNKHLGFKAIPNLIKQMKQKKEDQRKSKN